MAERDYIGRLLQILRIKSPVDAVSGDDIIAIETKMQYSELFPIIEDGDIIYKAYVDGLFGPITVTGTTDTSGNATATGGTARLIAVYEGNVLVRPEFNKSTLILSAMNPSTAFTAYFI